MSPEAEYDGLIDASHGLEMFFWRNIQIESVAARSRVRFIHKFVGEMTGISPNMRMTIDQQISISWQAALSATLAL